MVKNKFPKIVTVIGGPHPTAIPEKTLDYFTSADYGISGEGEIPLIYLIDALEGNAKLENCPGLIWKVKDKVKWNNKVEHKNIDDFGFPAWDLIDPRRYFNSPGIQGTGVIHTTRGCPFGCEFCVRLGRKLRYHSLEHIYSEIKLFNVIGTKTIIFQE